MNISNRLAFYLTNTVNSTEIWVENLMEMEHFSIVYIDYQVGIFIRLAKNSLLSMMRFERCI